MQVESWKEPLLKLPLDELKKAQCFVTDLIQTLETLHTTTEEPIVIFPPEEPIKIEERRRDKRFDMELEGVCSVVKKQESEASKDALITIKDISKRGLRFITNQSFTPSDILVVTFQLPPTMVSGHVYKNPQKKVYVEIRRVAEFPTPTGLKYDIGAQSIESERVVELAKEEENRTLINKRLAIKGETRILVVSIKEALSKRLEEFLLKQGYVVHKVSQKQQAIALLRKNKFDIVVSDIDTAKINEFELLKDIKMEFPNVGLIVEIDTIEDWKNILSLGVNNYLTKNFNDEEFNIILESVQKKLLYKSMFGVDFKKSRLDGLNILVLSRKEVLKNLLCSASKEKGLKLYFVDDTARALTVLKRYKIDFIIVDAEITGREGCQLLLNIKKDFPNIETVVISKNLQERCDFLVSGTDNFIVEPVESQEILAVLH
ncbi:MAG: response regulator [Planctomycetes bacterium]|uniref:response regulator n=1 Tax=Candidatus Wunengus sp. YC65 TaxID=3367701 RepID=UPI001D72218E|nr:response regulator [Planctomycetota bacterium]